MCGIAGLVRWRSAPADARALSDRVYAMAESVRHRGPDDAGLRTSPNSTGTQCVLAHRRLSIIDLAAGPQPLCNEDQTVWVVFNGEIYNFSELRDELLATGHRFSTHTDTEVLVHLWEQCGPDMLERLRGMFSFALWDERQQTFFAAVDPLGKKPFYYSADDRELRFGSELKCLRADRNSTFDIDPESLQLYLTVGYIPAPWTIYKQARKLQPGHYLLATTADIKVQRYWRPPVETRSQTDFDSTCRELRLRLSEAVKRRLIADVPLGAFLSGGIDSTIIVGLMNELQSRPVKTFTIAFDESRFDESPYAQVVARRFGADHHTLHVRPDAIDVLPKLAHHFDEPFGDSSAIPTYYVAKLTREHVTVALTGDGGDETFGGYRRYRRGKLAGMLGRVPGGRAAASLLGRLIPSAFDRTTDLGRARRVLRGLGRPSSDAYLEQMSAFPAMDKLLAPELSARLDADLPRRWFASFYDESAADPAAADMLADLQTYLPGDILTKVDRASMAVALECRSPFLDRDVVELGCTLPTHWRLRGLSGHKYILKEAFSDLLPPEITRRRKTGFAVPLADWFRGPLRPMLHDTLLAPSTRLSPWIDRRELQRLADEHQGGKNHSGPLWTLLMLETWARTWMS